MSPKTAFATKSGSTSSPMASGPDRGATIMTPAESEIMRTGTVLGLGRLPSKNALAMQVSFVILVVARVAVPYGWLIVMAFLAIS